PPHGDYHRHRGGHPVAYPRPAPERISCRVGRSSMNPEFDPIDPALEQAISEIRSGEPGETEVASAAARVWQHLSAPAPIRGCADFQALLPEYRAGTLPEARRVLI